MTGKLYRMRVAGYELRGAGYGFFDLGFEIWDFGLKGHGARRYGGPATVPAMLRGAGIYS